MIQHSNAIYGVLGVNMFFPAIVGEVDRTTMNHFVFLHIMLGFSAAAVVQCDRTAKRIIGGSDLEKADLNPGVERVGEAEEGEEDKDGRRKRAGASGGELGFLAAFSFQRKRGSKPK